jgi:hypothetical protein
VRSMTRLRCGDVVVACCLVLMDVEVVMRRPQGIVE